MVDVSNPAEPRISGHITADDPAYLLARVGNRIVVAGHAMSAYDLSDPDSPEAVAHFSLENEITATLAPFYDLIAVDDVLYGVQYFGGGAPATLILRLTP